MKRIFPCLFFVLLSLTANAQRDTIPVFFATGKSVLSEAVQDGLDNAIYKDVLHSGQRLQIVGYADYVGSNQSNDALSKARAAAVKRLLLGYGFEAKNITVCIGKGEVAREGVTGSEGSARDRRVDIVINGTEPMAPVVAGVKLLQPPPASFRKPAPVATRPADIATAKPNEIIRLENLYFYPGRHIIRPESRPVLGELQTVMENYPRLKISIEGHVCCVAKESGDGLDIDTHEIALSVNRAKEVYAFLIKRGIDEDRLSFRGFGGTRPLVEEHSEDDANKNRRVEIRVLEN